MVVTTQTLIIKEIENKIENVAPNFKVSGKRIREGNGNMTHLREGPETNEARLKTTIGPIKVQSSSHKDCAGTLFFEFTSLKKTNRVEYNTVNPKQINIIRTIKKSQEFWQANSIIMSFE